MNFEEWVIEMYGRSVEQIKLEVAIAYYTKGQFDPAWAWMHANKFVEEMRIGYEISSNRSESE